MPDCCLRVFVCVCVCFFFNEALMSSKLYFVGTVPKPVNLIGLNLAGWMSGARQSGLGLVFGASVNVPSIGI